MTDISPQEDEPQEAAPVPEVDEESVRRRAHELSKERPDATPEENWLLAEAQLRAEEGRRRQDDAAAREDAANLMAKLEMGVFGHP
ncbi:MAG TPA: hypothetical protein VLW49_07500 [Gaiellaceae bacterium]|nr:hypothetical protein [Gaiellaceae bacterium]